MFASLALLMTVATTVPAEAPDVPLDDLTRLAAMTDAEFYEAQAGLQNEALLGNGVAGMLPEADDRRRRHDREAAYRRAMRHDAEVLGPEKDRLRAQRNAFALPKDGFVAMPGPRAAGGRIAAAVMEQDLTQAGTTPLTQTQTQTQTQGTPVAQPLGVAGPLALEPAGAQATLSATAANEGAEASTGGDTASKGAAPGTLRMSFEMAPAKAVGAPAEAALATPLPPSFLLFASGVGLFRLSRRKGAQGICA